MKALLLVGLVGASMAFATPVTSQGTTTSSTGSPSGSGTVSTALTLSATVNTPKFTLPGSGTSAGAVQPFDVIAPGVPEPSSMLLMGTGLLAVVLGARRFAARPA